MTWPDLSYLPVQYFWFTTLKCNQQNKFSGSCTEVYSRCYIPKQFFDLISANFSFIINETVPAALCPPHNGTVSHCGKQCGALKEKLKKILIISHIQKQWSYLDFVAWAAMRCCVFSVSIGIVPLPPAASPPEKKKKKSSESLSGHPEGKHAIQFGRAQGSFSVAAASLLWVSSCDEWFCAESNYLFSWPQTHREQLRICDFIFCH